MSGSGSVAPLDAAIARGIAAGNINIATGAKREVMELSETSKMSIANTENERREVAMGRMARTVVAPTVDAEVKMQLRAMFEPITLFGEKPADRRERLQQLLALRASDSGEQLDSVLTYHAPKSRAALIAEEKAKLEKLSALTESETSAIADAQSRGVSSISEGVPELAPARKAIAQFSLPRAHARLEQAKKVRLNPQEDVDRKDKFVTDAAKFTPQLSQTFDARPLSGICIRPDGKQILTCGWSGAIGQWDLNGNLLRNTAAHFDRISDISYSVQPLNSGWCFATASVDKTIKLWIDADAMSEETNTLKPSSVLSGHFNRLSKLCWHPCNSYLASSSFDGTWRLWDINTSTCLCIQDGHPKGIYGLGIHPDGSLLASGDLGGIVRLWDLRSGRLAMDLVKHVKQVNTIDFHCDGFTLATGSDDSKIGIWDLRKRDCTYLIPAHTNLISTVKFQSQGAFLLSSSFDKTCKIFSCKDWSLVHTMALHEDKVMRADVSMDSNFIVSCCFDKTWKLWGM